MKIRFPCLRVLRLPDINLAGMEKVYYYYRIKNFIFRIIVLLLKKNVYLNDQINLITYGIY